MAKPKKLVKKVGHYFRIKFKLGDRSIDLASKVPVHNVTGVMHCLASLKILTRR